MRDFITCLEFLTRVRFQNGQIGVTKIFRAVCRIFPW